jgi:hypothetical protein
VAYTRRENYRSIKMSAYMLIPDVTNYHADYNSAMLTEPHPKKLGTMKNSRMKTQKLRTTISDALERYTVKYGRAPGNLSVLE